MKMIYYSLARSHQGNHDQQWIQSVRSLRQHNQSLPVCLLVYNGISDKILREADRNNVIVYGLGDYQEYLQRIHVHGAVLAKYPTLHKFLSLCELDTSELSQVLFLDCDTFFHDNPAILFDTYTDCDWYARESPCSRRSPFGYDPLNMDESALADIVSNEGLTPVEPFNAGVCLLNHGIWHTFAALRVRFLDNLWRLLVGRHQRAADGSDDHIRRDVLRTATYFDHARAIAYPSTNFWIAEEIALWLTLGRVDGISQGFLSSEHVVQNGEYADAVNSGRRWVLTHYFSCMEEGFFSYVPALAQ